MTFKCRVDGCDATKHKAKDLCAFHYERLRHGVPMAQRKRTPAAGVTCTVDGCNSGSVARGFCSKHHQRWRNHGDPTVTKISIEYGSGKDWRVGRDGYVLRYDHDARREDPSKSGLLYQHRHVMSEMIGRPLRTGENVHHINGDRANNSPENLELWESAQPAGQRLQDKASWCIDFLIENIEAAKTLDYGIQERVLALASALKL